MAVTEQENPLPQLTIPSPAEHSLICPLPPATQVLSPWGKIVGAAETVPLTPDAKPQSIPAPVVPFLLGPCLLDTCPGQEEGQGSRAEAGRPLGVGWGPENPPAAGVKACAGTPRLGRQCLTHLSIRVCPREGPV